MSLNGDTTMTMPVAPVGYSSNGGGNGLFGNGEGSWFIIILFLFAFLGWGGNRGGGFGGGNGSQPYVINTGGESAGIQRSFDHSAVITKLDGITQGICDSTYALNNAITNGFNNTNMGMMQGFNGVERGFCQLGAQLANCCCETREAIQGVNYNLATQSCETRSAIQNSTRDLLENNNSNARAILDALNQNYIRSLESENQSLKLAASQSSQNAVLMAAMDANKAEILRRSGHDCPSAAYIVQPPTPVNFPTNCCGTFTGGWGNGNCGGC